MGFKSADDFFALLRGNASGGQDVLRAPMIDAVCQVLADAGAINLIAGPGQPEAQQTTTAWLQTATPSYNAQGVLMLWNGALYVPATPELFVEFLLASSVTIPAMKAATAAAQATANAALAATTEPATTTALGLVREATNAEAEAGVTAPATPTPAAMTPEDTAAAITAQSAAAIPKATSTAFGLVRVATTPEAQAGATQGTQRAIGGISGLTRAASASAVLALTNTANAAVGDFVEITGATPSTYNGTWPVTVVVPNVSITFTTQTVATDAASGFTAIDFLQTPPAAMTPELTAAAIGALGVGAQSPNIPPGRLTLVSGVPFLNTAEIGMPAIIYALCAGNKMGLWNGANFAPTTIPELSQLLTDGVYSPAPAIAASVYDMFIWNNNGTPQLSRGPAWSSVTARGYNLNRVDGVLVNPANITNGPAAGYGTYVGTIMTDPATATVSFNPAPAAASGGPVTTGTFNGGSIGLWNYYNRKQVSVVAQDSKASWTDGTNGWQAMDFASNSGQNNRITTIVGVAEDSVSIDHAAACLPAGVGSSYVSLVGIGVNSVTTPSGLSAPGYLQTGTSVSLISTPRAAYEGISALGQNIYQALEYAVTAATFYGSGLVGQTQQLLGRFWY